MRVLVNEFNTKVERLEGDKTRSRAFTLEQIKSEREATLPALGRGRAENAASKT